MTSRMSDADPLNDHPHASLKTSALEHPASAGHTSPVVSPSGRHSFESHARAKSPISHTAESGVGLPRHNRFSVSFPVQLSRTTSPVRSSQSPVREAPSVVPESLALLSGPSDGNFLTAIAAQERRVLELKEELSKAEAELNKLKRQWAQHEAQRKRDDAQRVTKLQPLQTTSLHTTEAEDDSDGSNAWMQQEMERRKAMLNSNPASSRTVFSGSRHMRTLSLLSPAGREAPTAQLPRKSLARSPQKLSSTAESVQRSRESDTRPVRPVNTTKASTTPAIVAEVAETALSDVDGTENGLDKEMLLRTSKKMATDLRDGLWTFWEDLRQATVGEEATKVEPLSRRRESPSHSRSARRQNSKTSLRASSKDSTSRHPSTETEKPSKSEAVPLGDSSFWSEHGVSINQQATPAKVKKTSPAVRHAKSASKVSSIASSDNDCWEAWEEGSPLGSRASSAASEATTVPSTISNAASPRTSADMPQSTSWTPTSQQEQKAPESSKKDPIPWPALSNLGPKALRRTASHLMAEWERSLTPSPTKDGGEQDYLGLGAEAAAAALPSERRPS